MSVLFEISAYDHVGIRVSERAGALAFYGALGFRIEWDPEGSDAIELVNDAGLHIHLLVNGVSRDGQNNILLDEAVKHPGVTHPAFITDDLAAAMRAVGEAGIQITEGPVHDARRSYFFIRDPDGNVVEINQLK